MSRLGEWLRDPFLGRLYRTVRAAGPIRSISVDLTHDCNIRCEGCYFFAEKMDRRRSPTDSGAVHDFVSRELERGTNFVTVVGGEPALVLDRLAVFYRAFKLSVATNGLLRIPHQGFENLPIGVSVWGDAETDRRVRGGGRVDVFGRALANYRDDPRAFFYYTVAADRANEVDRVVERCIQNGNRVLFNFFGDPRSTRRVRCGFSAVRRAIDRAIERHPEWVLMTSRLAEVVATGRLFEERWGHETCTSLTPDHPANRHRVENGKVYNRHFRAFNADLRSTRRCCTGVDRDCATCYDTWQHFSWVMLNPNKHLGSLHEFTQWLATMYLFYFINRLIDVDQGARDLAEIHRRTRRLATAVT